MFSQQGFTVVYAPVAQLELEMTAPYAARSHTLISASLGASPLQYEAQRLHKLLLSSLAADS
jgi:hypothetical protein